MTVLHNIILQSQHGRPFLADINCIEDGTPKPVIIFTHGFQGFKDWGPYSLMADEFARAGFIFVKYNLSHNGTTVENPMEFTDLEAFGNNNFEIELDDMDVVIDWVRSDIFPIGISERNTEEIYLIGHSRGGGLAILKAGEDNRIKKISTWASVNEYGKHWKGGQMQKIKEDGVVYVTNGRTKQRMPIYWQMYENYFANLKRFFIPAIFKTLTIPVLIIHGTDDETVPYTTATELKEWKPEAELLPIENGNHVFGGKHPYEEKQLPQDFKTVIDATIRFFKK